MIHELATLLRELIEDDNITNYDSSVCWGCGELLARHGGKCLPDCVLERSRRALVAYDAGSR